MLPGVHSPGGGGPQEQNGMTEAQEILLARDPISGGSPVQTDLIRSQPSAAPPGAPACPPCGLCPPPSPHPMTPQQGFSSSKESSRRSKRKRRNEEAPHPTADAACPRMLLACLSCQASVLLLALLEAFCSCLHALCASCCRAAARCCAAVQDAPVEELTCHAHCHQVLFQSCCEPTECLEFCLECCDICHRS
ncbi:myoD family inhibitor-like isoform X2 [Antennarius striatus]|uniref:myoD family inhibitor-like isoform X2 n=1 Tax=Antennarius striatus TaxID=241820 RepID=UPI0035AECB64